MFTYKFFGIYCASILLMSLSVMGQSKGVFFKHNEKGQEVEILINGDHFSSYLYHDALKKPVLYPLKSKSNKVLTRGFPLDPQAGERVDHPHHLGHWFNYGDVNGLDFWNNSSARPADQKHKYGEIRHVEFTEMQTGKKKGVLGYRANWINPAGEILLEEETRFVFQEKKGTRIIQRETRLKAVRDVSFTDNKEGMFAIRVTRELELPSNKPGWFADANGKALPEKSVSTKAGTADYLSSEGGTGKKVWGTRAKWMKLHGKLAGTAVEVIILDHPQNPGYPTYWHARDYGLFSANPLGQAVFSKGKETLNFSLLSGKSVTFKYQILIHEGENLSTKAIEKYQNKSW